MYFEQFGHEKGIFFQSNKSLNAEVLFNFDFFLDDGQCCCVVVSRKEYVASYTKSLFNMSYSINGI